MERIEKYFVWGFADPNLLGPMHTGTRFHRERMTPLAMDVARAFNTLPEWPGAAGMAFAAEVDLAPERMMEIAKKDPFITGWATHQDVLCSCPHCDCPHVATVPAVKGGKPLCASCAAAFPAAEHCKRLACADGIRHTWEKHPKVVDHGNNFDARMCGRCGQEERILLPAQEMLKKAWVTPKEAAKIKGMSHRMVRETIEKGRVQAQKVGTVWMVNLKSLMEYDVTRALGMERPKKPPKPHGGVGGRPRRLTPRPPKPKSGRPVGRPRLPESVKTQRAADKQGRAEARPERGEQPKQQRKKATAQA